MKIVGNILIFLSVIILLTIFGPVLVQESKYALDQTLNIKYSVDTEEEGTFEKPLKIPNLDFSIVIPKIAAAAPIIDNVDPNNQIEYLKALKLGVAHARGTALPGQPGNVYLFAHSTDAIWNVSTYNAVFYLLGKLKQGDGISIYFQGQEIKYQVDEVGVVDAKDIQYLGGSRNANTLTLQTCYPPGTTLKRLIVLAKEVGS